MRIQAHVLAQHSQSEPSPPSSSPARDFLCPLCQDGFRDRSQLERHVMQIHSVNSEGLQRLLLLVDQSHWLNAVSRSAPSTPQQQQQHAQQQTPPGPNSHHNQMISPSSATSSAGSSTGGKDLDLSGKQNHSDVNSTEDRDESTHPDLLSPSPDDQVDIDEFRCQTCFKTCRNIDELCMHQNETGHLEIKQTPSGPGYLFRSVLALHKHVETSHSELSEDELAAYKQSLMSNPLLLAGLSGQVLDPSTNDLLKKESLKMESDDIMDVDESPNKDQSHQDDGMGSNIGDGENSDDSVVYKEQQFLEDYLNSQAIAEDSYNDPNRKYKCHRCKVAFTRQSYLTSHNKTLLHRKGEKLSYPMEKYLDPNRPYKCDVCKESFTQKNILLVHYNSVSHLHKLKRAMQEQQQQQNNNNNNGVSAVSPHAAASAAAALAASLGVTPPPTPKSTSVSEDDDKKPYKCNICKVAYSQGSTLDIHMRSVLHQTRASKLQDLAITGQIDLSKPLIEQPEPQKAQDQHKKMLQDILGTSPKQQQLTSPSSGGSSSTSSSGVTSQVPSLAPGSSPIGGSNIVPQSSAAVAASVSINNPIMSSVPNSLTNNSTTTSTSNTMANHHHHHTQAPPSPQQQQHGMLSCQRCSALFVNQEQLTTHQQLYCLFGSPMSLFPPLPAPQQQNSSVSVSSQASHNSPQPGAKTPPPVPTTPQQEDTFMRLSMPGKKSSQHCRKEFSSVWVLKAHCEEVHRDLVPPEFLEKYAQQFKSEYEKKSVVVTAATSTTPTGTPVVSTPTGQHSVSTSTSTTTDSIPATLSTSMAAAVAAAASGMGGPGSASASAGNANSNLSMSLAQQMSEMQAALNVMAASQLQQQLQQFGNPMMMGMAGLGMGLPLGLNMNALAAMNLQPPLVNAAQQKRARTRITDDQLKILRAHFDINNSPSEDQIHEMATQSGLPPKVIKHWFRNTLFKERQRNKDSPYNFNNPPSTTLNLEEYEKTGEAKVMPLNTSGSGNEDQQTPNKELTPSRPPSTSAVSPASASSSSNKRKQSQPQPFPPPQAFPQPTDMIKSEPREISTHTDNQEHKFNNLFMDEHGNNRKDSDRMMDLPDEKPHHNIHPPPSPVTSMANTSNNDNSNIVPPPGMIRSSSPGSLTLTSIIASQLGSDSITTTHPTMNASNMTITSSTHSAGTNTSNMLPPKLTPPNFPPPNQVPNSPGILPPLTSAGSGLSRSVSPGRSYSTNSSDGFGHGSLTPGACGANSNGSNSSGSSGKRANRTRFTDYQIKVLQEFFENNAYPKDDDLEYLSKLLSLSPRVIVVWFQNARQKARKVYENQPPVETPPGVDEGGANRFQRTPGLNYQCKKCLLVFQRYYELIRHQKTHCFKEEDAKRSAQAQAAAAQIAAVLSSEDSNSSTIAEPSQQQPPQSQQSHQQPSVVSVTSTPSNPATPSGAVTPTPPSSLFPPSPISSAATLFKVKSALESHLVTKHADQCTRGEINIDNLPDEELSMESSPSFTSSQMGESGKVSSNFGSTTPTPNMMPPLFPPFHTDMENSLKKYYEESMKRYISELQAHHAAQNGGISKEGLHIPTDLSLKIKQEPSTPGSEGGVGSGGGSGGGVSGGGDGPLDLSKPVDLSRPVKLTLEHESRALMAEPGPLTDLSERSLCYEDDSMSETTENMDGDESNPTSPASSTQSTHQRQLASGGGKRFRTQMSSLQVKAMKSLFNDYKTPTMAECEMLGREIGLPKRVVQVWFQNARAKEKKNKIALQKALGGPETSPGVVSTSDQTRPPEECKLCQFKYSHKYSIQDHIFTKKHIDNVKAAIESGKNDNSGNTSDGGGSGEFTVPPVPGSSVGPEVALPSQQSPQFGNNSAVAAHQQQLAQLQMLQMAAASGLALPNSLSAQAMAAAAAAAAANSGKDQHGGNGGGSKSPGPGVPGPEDMALLHQLYGLGLAGFPGAMQAGNLFLHPAMFSAAAGE
ncbi:hypothetical protein C0J52_24542 [Blattella germanica]|nr:hypothetical protein C0J52_24542 [Blattella germanica]